MHYFRMIFEEEKESYPTKLEAFKTNDYSVIIDIQPADSADYDPIYSQSIELNALDVRALATELNRLATEIESEAVSDREEFGKKKKPKEDSAPLFRFENHLNGNLEKVG